MKSIYKYIIFLCMGCSALHAQSLAHQTDLIKTVFTRQFDKTIIKNYLASGNEQKQNAALLAIAQSGDTSFINVVIQNYRQSLHKNTCFALSRLGNSAQSVSFLYNSVLTSTSSSNAHESFIALGKTAPREMIPVLAEAYKNVKMPFANGISLSAFYLMQRGFQSIELINLVKAELDSIKSVDRLREALFTAARGPANPSYKASLAHLFQNAFSLPTDAAVHQYLLAAMRRNGIVINDNQIVQFYLQYQASEVRVEAAKLFILMTQNDSLTISRFTTLIADKNQNVALQAAGSCKNAKFRSTASRLFFIDKLIECLQAGELSANVKCELAQSILSLDKQFSRVIFPYVQSLPFSQRYKVLSSFPDQYLSELSAALIGINSQSAFDKCKMLGMFPNLQENISLKELCDSILIDLLQHETNPFVLASAIENTDTTLLKNYYAVVSPHILQVSREHKDEANYADLFNNILNIKTKPEIPLVTLIREIAHDSHMRSLNKEFSKINPDTALFNKILPFLGKTARIEVATTKGKFILQLNPETAPVSCANILYLISKEYFNKLLFHRVVPGFVIQGGDPSGT
ncbi:MAG: peptidylprolyl isomerase, partial [Ignavibacteria bacterium]|nr:peptidylprolyl isomerase [Ignavibacteria bacterium]